jgi:hypothetical protein
MGSRASSRGAGGANELVCLNVNWQPLSASHCPLILLMLESYPQYFLGAQGHGRVRVFSINSTRPSQFGKHQGPSPAGRGFSAPAGKMFRGFVYMTWVTEHMRSG